MTHPFHHARVHPDHPAVVMAHSGETVTYAALECRSNQAAHLFRALGLLPGDHVAFLVDNCAQFQELCWAAQRSGLYFTPISTRLLPDEIEYIVRDCDAQLLVASSSLADKILRLAPDLTAHRYVLGGDLAGIARWEEAAAAFPATPLSDEVMGYEMLYSSGTTGKPKGILTPFARSPIDSSTPVRIAIRERYGFDEHSIYLSPAPLYHGAPVRFNMAVASFGGTSVIMDHFDAEDLLKYIEKYRVTHVQLVPTMFVRLLKLPQETRRKYDLSFLQCAIHAAAPCPAQIKEQMIAWWGLIIWEYYGGTEANGLVGLDSAEWLAHRGSVGRALFGTVKIVGEDGNELPALQTGAVYFADGPAFEYHKDQVKTAKAHNALGWSTLGDIGHVDENGYLYLTDRKAFVIISGGVNVYPQEAEDILASHPKVLDAAVFGVPDADLGESVKAVVQPVDMADAGGDLEAELIAWCRQHLAAFKCPRSIDFEVELPRHATGKLFKQVLKQRYWDASRQGEVN